MHAMFHTYTLFLLPLVSASIYPTQPVQATVWTADQPMLVTWIDDYKYPTLSQMGMLSISLWSDTGTFLVQLASGVDPVGKTSWVTAPGAVLNQASTFMLQFSTNKPTNTVIYSASFVITPNTTRGAGTRTGATTGGSGVALATQSGTLRWTGTGSGSMTGSGFKTVPTAMTTGFSIPCPCENLTSGAPHPSETMPKNGGPAPGEQRAASAGRRGVDVEKLKFRFVFVIWPVLMGIAMAL